MNFLKNIFAFFRSDNNEIKRSSIDVNISIKKEDIKTEDITFNKEFFARILFYGLLIGFIHNFAFYNLCYGINIFDYMQPSELLFSWIGSSQLLQALSFFTVLYFLGRFYNKI